MDENKVNTQSQTDAQSTETPEKETVAEKEVTEQSAQETIGSDIATAYCGACGAPMLANATFCSKCGKPKVDAATPYVQDAPNNESKKKKNKKKGCLMVFLAIIGVIVLVFVGKPAVTSISNNIALSKAESVVEDYRESNIDYEKAVSIVEKLKTNKNTEVVNLATEAEKEIAILKESKDHFEKGMLYLGKKDYQNVLLHMSKVVESDPNYEKAQQEIERALPEIEKTLPAQIDALLKEKKTDEALELIDNFLNRKDSKSISEIKTFIEAEKKYATGYLNTAQGMYKQLPADLKVNGITVKSRLDTLSKYSAYVNMCGKWKTTKYYYETKEQWDSGRWYNWYNDGTSADRYLTVTCIINGDGTVSVSGWLSFKTYTNYSSVTANLNADVFDSYFSKKLNATDKTFTHSFSTGDFTVGGTTLKDSQKLVYNGNKFTYNFQVKYNYSRSCDEIYKADVTFGERVEKY